jgi:hypothetical protein
VGFTPRPLGLASGGGGGNVPSVPSVGVGRSQSLGTTVEPPKVDLKRTWSVSSWMPNQFLSRESRKKEDEEGGEEAVALVGR